MKIISLVITRLHFQEKKNALSWAHLVLLFLKYFFIKEDTKA